MAAIEPRSLPGHAAIAANVTWITINSFGSLGHMDEHGLRVTGETASLPMRMIHTPKPSILVMLPLPQLTPRRIAFATVLFVGAIVAASGCSSDPESARWSRGEAVGRLVAEVLLKKDSVQTVNLAELAPFRWDRLFIFAPYTTTSTVEQSLGQPWSGAERSNIARVDTATLLVFMTGNEIVAATMQPRDYGDFTPAASTSPLSPGQALFRVERRPGSGWIMHEVR